MCAGAQYTDATPLKPEILGSFTYMARKLTNLTLKPPDGHLRRRETERDGLTDGGTEVLRNDRWASGQSGDGQRRTDRGTVSKGNSEMEGQRDRGTEGLRISVREGRRDRGTE